MCVLAQCATRPLAATVSAALTQPGSPLEYDPGREVTAAHGKLGLPQTRRFKLRRTTLGDIELVRPESGSCLRVGFMVSTIRR
jgi:hypothetical protein